MHLQLIKHSLQAQNGLSSSGFNGGVVCTTADSRLCVAEHASGVPGLFCGLLVLDKRPLDWAEQISSSHCVLQFEGCF